MKMDRNVESIEMAEGAKPCPMCGNGEIYVEGYEHHKGSVRYRVLCPKCMCCQDTGTDQTKLWAIDRWNTRNETGKTEE